MLQNLENRFNAIIKKIKEPAVVKKFNRKISFDKTAGPELPHWVKNQTLYEVYLRSFTPEGTIRAFQSKLPQLKKLGIDFIWLMPVYPVGQENRKGREGSPYAVRDYFSVNPEFGSEKDLKDLVDEAHRQGFKVLVDMVANHVAPDYSALQKQPDLIKRDSKGNPFRKVDDWSDIADLDYNNPDTAKHMAEIITYWLKEYNLDGYRCDVAGMVPMQFWESVFPDLKNIRPDVFMLAEWDGPHMHEKVFHSTYDWVLYELMSSVFKGEESAFILLEWQDVHKKIYPQNALALRFLENHDLPRAAKIFGKGLIPFLTFIFTIDGLPLLYTGQETGTADYLSLFDKNTVDWQEQNDQLYKFYQHLIHLRRKMPTMYSSDIKICMHNQIPDMLVYEKKADDQKIIVMLNVRDKRLKLGPGEEMLHKISGSKVIFNSEKEFNVTDNEIQILPYQAVILQEK